MVDLLFKQIPEETKNIPQRDRRQVYDSKLIRGMLLGFVTWASLKAYVPLETMEKLDKITGSAEES